MFYQGPSFMRDDKCFFFFSFFFSHDWLNEELMHCLPGLAQVFVAYNYLAVKHAMFN